MRKLITIFIMVIMALLLCVISLSAGSVYVSISEDNPDWPLLAKPGYRISGYNAHINIDGKDVFCLEPLSKFEAGNHEIVKIEDLLLSNDNNAKLRLDQSDLARMTLFVEYARSEYDQSEAYAIAQNLIWHDLYKDLPAINAFFVIGSKSIKKPNDLLPIYNDALKYIAKVQKAPSFVKKIYRLNYGEELKIDDANKVLADYELSYDDSLLEVIKTGNSLKIKALKPLNTKTKISLSHRLNSKYDGENQALVKAGSQSVAYLDKVETPKVDLTINMEAKGDLTLYKQDSETNDQTQGTASFKGAVFGIYDEDNHLLERLITDQDGKATSSSYPNGTILKIKELSAPSGYQLSDEVLTVTIRANETIKLIYKDEVIKRPLEIYKHDSRLLKVENPYVSLKGTTYEVSYGDQKDIYQSDENGYVKTKEYPIGTNLKVCEISPPKGYELGEDYCQSVTVGIDSSLSLDFYNDIKLGYVEIHKEDSETITSQGEATFKGTTFVINSSLGQETLILQDESYIRSQSYPIGEELEICELKAGAGYKVNGACKKLVIEKAGLNEDNINHVTFKNEVKKGNIALLKSLRDDPSEVQRPGIGIGFEIYEYYEGKKGALIETIITDEDGLATSNDLPYGHYLIEELTPKDHVPLKPFVVFINGEKKTHYFHIDNDSLKTKIKILKYDIESGRPIALSGISFKIKDSEGNYLVQHVNYPDDVDIDTFVTNEKGEVTLSEELESGKTYFIEEIQAPYGYILASEDLSFKAEGEVLEVIFYNKAQKGELVIDKLGHELREGEKVMTEFGEMLTYHKVDVALDGAIFGIYAKEDIKTGDGTLHYIKDELVKVVESKNGQARSGPLMLGSYYVKELKAPDGYVLSSDIYEVEFTYAGQEVALQSKTLPIYNDLQTLKINLQKVMDEDHPHYDDVVFGLFDEKDRLVDLLRPDENGFIAQEIKLPYGNYYLKELKTHRSYELDKNEYPLTFDTASHDIDLGKIKNELRKINVILEKVSASDHRYRLNGAYFRVFDEKRDLGLYVSGGFVLKNVENKTVEVSSNPDFKEFKSYEGEPLIIIEDLDAGKYYWRYKNDAKIHEFEIIDGSFVIEGVEYGHTLSLQEVKAPIGFKLDDEAFSILVESETNTLEFERSNQALLIIPATADINLTSCLIIGIGTMAGLITFAVIKLKRR